MAVTITQAITNDADYRTADAAYTSLVNATSHVDPTRMLVVPGNPAQSYIMYLTGAIKPEDADPPLGPIPASDPSSGAPVGTMPQQSTGFMCCQELDAISRWIAAGAMND